MRSVCVYCGSSEGADPRYGEAAEELGQALAAAGVTLVYGGGQVGLMGRVADATLAAGGRVVGVIPVGLFSREVPHRGLHELVEVASMHERKMEMFERSDAFVALPGGLGTLEELTEVTTWAQLGLHSKPIVTVNIAGYWDPLHRLLANATSVGFMKADNLSLITDVSTVADVMPLLLQENGPTPSG